MPFNTFSYFLFLPVVFLLHYFTPDRFRWLVLLGASFFFYAALKAPHLIAVLLLITTITYVTGILIDRQKAPETKKYLLWGGIFANVLTLIILKYLPFITQNINLILKYIAPGTTVPVSKAIIAIGVSYFIFQAISYLIDIYLEIESPERHYGYFALYMAFFPKLLQGPIERSGDLIPQLKKTYTFDYYSTRSGLILFMWGLFKKVVVADRLSLYVNSIYGDVHIYKGFPLIIGTYAYAMQIYFDFSGYTDMARGTGKIFGINLTENFDKPYSATSIADFWRRWHISFSRWILDYIFKPLQMAWRDWGKSGTALSLIITFTVSGIWHGANWGYIVWGLLHGLYLASSTYYRPYQTKLHKLLKIEKSKWLKHWQMLVTFNLVCVAWVFFRARSLKEAIYVIKHSCNNYDIYIELQTNGLSYVIKKYIFMGNGAYEFIVITLVLIFVKPINALLDDISSMPTIYRWLIYFTLTYSVVFLKSGSNQFIYFNY